MVLCVLSVMIFTSRTGQYLDKYLTVWLELSCNSHIPIAYVNFGITIAPIFLCKNSLSYTVNTFWEVLCKILDFFSSYFKSID